MTETSSRRIDIKTVPFDPRFPNTNQTKRCFQNYLDFHRCQKKRGEDYEPCQYFRNVFKVICPSKWIDDWDGKRERGIFAADI